MNNKSAYIIIGIAVVAIVAILAFSGNDQTPNEQNATTTPSSTTTENTAIDGNTGTATSGEEDAATEQHTVTYTGSEFTPESIIVSTGDTVVFKNEGSSGMWVASDQHPTHTNYSGTTLSEHCGDESESAFDSCTKIGAGASWAFTFEKTGEWEYHNHVAPSHKGTVVVE